MDPPYTLVPVLYDYDTDEEGLFSWQTGPKSRGKRTARHEEFRRITLSAIGAVLGLISGSSYAISAVFILLVQNMGVTQFQIKFITGLVGVATALPVIVYNSVDVRLESWKDRIILISNGLVGTVSAIALLYALPHAPLGNINSLIQGSLSIVTALLACGCLKEVCSIPEVVASILNAVGILFITRPEFLVSTKASPSRSENIAYILTLLSVVGISAGYVIGRAVRKRVHVFTIMLYNSAVNTITNFVFMFVIAKSHWEISLLGVFYLFGVCASGLISTWTRYESLRLESAASVALLSNIQIVISYLADVFIFHYSINPYDYVGASLVIASSLVISVSSCAKKLHLTKGLDKSKQDEEREEMRSLQEFTDYEE